jgi:hypothetical protein
VPSAESLAISAAAIRRRERTGKTSRKPPKTTHLHPSSYVEVLEAQRKQLIAGLEGMYWRLVNASAWDSPPLQGAETGKPHPHSIFSALGCLDTVLDATSSAASPMDSSSSPQVRLMSAQDIPSLDVPHLKAESRPEEEAQQACEIFPTASMSWSGIDISLLLPEKPMNMYRLRLDQLCPGTSHGRQEYHQNPEQCKQPTTTSTTPKTSSGQAQTGRTTSCFLPSTTSTLI